MHRAIETRYKGYRFRSRLEARYAILFDALGAKWDYKPEGFELGGGLRYLPDFFIQFPALREKYPGAGYWVEIKPNEPTEEERRKLVLLCAQTKHHGYIFCGSPERPTVWCCSFRGDGSVSRVGEDHKPPYNLLWSAPISCCAQRLQKCGGSKVFYGLFDAAVIAAKSARFEFGETGRRA